jgi:hypothetical protein
MQMRKNCTFSNILLKVNSFFLPISIILRLIPIEIPTKSIKLKPPILQGLGEWLEGGLRHLADVVVWKVEVAQAGQLTEGGGDVGEPVPLQVQQLQGRLHSCWRQGGWDLADWLERLTANAPVATVLGSIPASAGTVESEGRQMKHGAPPPKKNIKKENEKEDEAIKRVKKNRY